jgi:acetoacetyl-CoA synthetase
MNDVFWTPITPEKTNMAHFMRQVEQEHALSFAHYEALHAWSIEHPALFWQSVCDYFKVKFNTPPKEIFRAASEMIDAQWFKGATFNFAEKMLSRDDDHPALICIHEQGSREVLSYRELQFHVRACAAGMKHAGVESGHRIAGILPNGKYPIIAMLAAASIGAIWSSCSPDFGTEALIDRFRQIEPSILFVCDGYSYNNKCYALAPKIKAITHALPQLIQTVICPIIHDASIRAIMPNVCGWDEFLKPVSARPFEAFDFNHPLTLLFSSGTTGLPKCILHGAGGTFLQHLKELGLHTDLSSEDTLFFYTTCGWMMWNWMVSTLALGATLVLYDGAPTYPTAHRLFEIVNNEQVTVFGTSAKFLSSTEHANVQPGASFPFTTLRCILSTGSPLLPKQYDFVHQHIKPGIQLSSISGGTDIISCFALGNPIRPVYRGELQCIGLGMNVAIVNEQGEPVREAIGELVCRSAFPSMPLAFWNDPDRTQYKHAYFDRFPGLWAHGDYAEITAHEGLIIHGRSDATLNPGGVRIGTAEIYRQLAQIPAIIDSVVIGQDWQDDTRIVLFVTLKEGIVLDDALQASIRQTIRTNASPRHVPAKIIQVPDIPRTINGKTVELAVRRAVHGQPILQLSSLANPESLEYFKNRAELSVA